MPNITKAQAIGRLLNRAARSEEYGTRCASRWNATLHAENLLAQAAEIEKMPDAAARVVLRGMGYPVGPTD